MTSSGNQRAKLESLLAPAVGTSESDPRTTAAMSDEDLVNALAQYLGLEPLEKQALIEQESLRGRAESLVELLEMKIMMARTPGTLERRALTAISHQAIPFIRCAMTSRIFSPWKRPFSMNTVPVSTPASAPPATNNPGTLVSKVSAS